MLSVNSFVVVVIFFLTLCLHLHYPLLYFTHLSNYKFTWFSILVICCAIFFSFQCFPVIFNFFFYLSDTHVVLLIIMVYTALYCRYNYKYLLQMHWKRRSHKQSQESPKFRWFEFRETEKRDDNLHLLRRSFNVALWNHQPMLLIRRFQFHPL